MQKYCIHGYVSGDTGAETYFKDTENALLGQTSGASSSIPCLQRHWKAMLIRASPGTSLLSGHVSLSIRVCTLWVSSSWKSSKMYKIVLTVHLLLLLYLSSLWSETWQLISELLYLAEKSAPWEFESIITKSRPPLARACRMSTACKWGSWALPCPRVQLWQICGHTLDGGTRRGGLFSTFLFHVFELLPCKSQFAKKHDKIMVGPAESAQLCCAKLISAVNHVRSQNTKAGLCNSANCFILYIYFCQKLQSVCQPLFFFLSSVYIELSLL